MRSSLLIPTQKTLELLVHQAQSRADRIIYSALTNGLRVNNGRAFHSVVSPLLYPGSSSNRKRTHLCREHRYRHCRPDARLYRLA